MKVLYGYDHIISVGDEEQILKAKEFHNNIGDIPNLEIRDLSEFVNSNDPLDKQLDDLATAMRVSYDEVYMENGKLCIHIIWGDWKHDHRWMDTTVQEVFKVKRIEKQTTEENGGDAYSAIHKYTLEQ